MMMMIDAESPKRCGSTSSSSLSYSPSSSSASGDRLDRLLDSEELEAAETLAHLAMRETRSTDKCRIYRLMPESPTHDSDPSPLAPAGQAVAGQQLDEKTSTPTSVETERVQQDDSSRHVKVELDTDLLPKTTSYSLVRSSKSRRNLTEEEKEARRMRRILANRESARQTIRRRQALCEELNRKAATLVLENDNLKREKELALKEYQSLETTNKHLKAQITKSINSEVKNPPVEPESSVTEVTPLSGNSPWFLYNHFPVTQMFWRPIFQSSNPVQLQHTSFNSIAFPSNANVPCPSESESCYKQNNLTNDNQTQNSLYMFPCPWIFPLPSSGNDQSSPSSSLKDKHYSKQCSSSSSWNTVANVDYQAAPPIKLKTEASGWTEAWPIDDPGYYIPRFSLDGSDNKAGYHVIEKLHGPALGCNDRVSSVKQEHELQSLSAPNPNVSPTPSYIANSLLEKKQEQFVCQGKNLVDAVAATEARKRRKELTKQKNIHNRQFRMHC